MSGVLFNLKSKVMTYEELKRPLNRMTKAQLVDTLASVVNLLTNSFPTDCDYGLGWHDSRLAIMDISGLNSLYDIQPLEEV